MLSVHLSSEALWALGGAAFGGIAGLIAGIIIGWKIAAVPDDDDKAGGGYSEAENHWPDVRP